VAAHALRGEACVLAVGLEVVASPSSPAPALCRRVLAAVLDHELYLDEGARPGVAVLLDLLSPRGFGEDGTVGPGIDVVFRDSLDSDVVAEDDTHGVIVEALCRAEDLPVFIVGDVLDSVRSRMDVESGGACLNPPFIFSVRGDLHGWIAYLRWRGGIEVVLQDRHLLRCDDRSAVDQPIALERHLARLDLVDGLVERCILLSDGQLAYFGEVQVLSGFFHIAGDKPIRGGDAIEPGKVCLVGVAVIAGVSQYLLHLWRGLQVGCHGWIVELRPNRLYGRETHYCDKEEDCDCSKAILGRRRRIFHSSTLNLCAA